MTAGSRTPPTRSAGARNGQEIHQIAREAGRDPAQLTGAVYLTLTIDEDKARAEERMNAFMQNYYGQPASVMRARQATYAGPAEGAAEWLSSWVAGRGEPSGAALRRRRRAPPGGDRRAAFENRRVRWERRQFNAC